MKRACCRCDKVHDSKTDEWNDTGYSGEFEYSHGFCPPCYKLEADKMFEKYGIIVKPYS